MVTANEDVLDAFRLARELLTIRGSYYPTWDDQKSDQENYDAILAYVKAQIALAHKIIDEQDEELLCKAT